MLLVWTGYAFLVLPHNWQALTLLVFLVVDMLTWWLQGLGIGATSWDVWVAWGLKVEVKMSLLCASELWLLALMLVYLVQTGSSSIWHFQAVTNTLTRLTMSIVHRVWVEHCRFRRSSCWVKCASSKELCTLIWLIHLLMIAENWVGWWSNVLRLLVMLRHSDPLLVFRWFHACGWNSEVSRLHGHFHATCLLFFCLNLPIYVLFNQLPLLRAFHSFSVLTHTMFVVRLVLFHLISNFRLNLL
jgi:hypothetical protein